MNIASTIGRIAAVLATLGALTALAGVAQAGTSRPPSMSQGEYRALSLRSEALNTRYGVDKQKAAAVAAQPTNVARGFAWGAFGIGAAVTFGLALLAGAFVVRRRILATLRGLAPRYRTT